MRRETIAENLRAALKQRDALRLSVFRMLSSAIHNREIEERTRRGRSELRDEDIAQVLRAELKKRRDAAAAYAAGGRVEAAAQEQAEAEIISSLLPPELSDAELDALVVEGRAAVAAAGHQDFGKIMGWVMARAQGRASGERVSAAVKRCLAGA